LIVSHLLLLSHISSPSPSPISLPIVPSISFLECSSLLVEFLLYLHLLTVLILTLLFWTILLLLIFAIPTLSWWLCIEHFLHLVHFPWWIPILILRILWLVLVSLSWISLLLSFLVPTSIVPKQVCQSGSPSCWYIKRCHIPRIIVIIDVFETQSLLKCDNIMVAICFLAVHV
jgi:hypothetical protein